MSYRLHLHPEGVPAHSLWPTDRYEVSGFDSQPWRSEALCAQSDPEAWFPEKGGTTGPAKRICALCPVQKECLEWALENNERFGVWGGKSERERRRILLQRNPPAETAALLARQRNARLAGAKWAAMRRNNEEAAS